jgi:hypothetical protein
MSGIRPAKKSTYFFLRMIGSVPRALRASSFCCFRAAGHLDPFPVDKSIGNLPSGFVQVAPRGLAGYPEFFCRLFLFEPFEIDEPDQLDLVRQERYSLSFFRVATGFIAAGFRAAGYGAPEPWSSPAGTW